ncbi:MAG TPA: potassium-transporting ATPase subunit KdpA [Candidatus Cybelea sp.]|jgi:K+-transporting ATPase ATPase A chain|nr:potassium-transporting ATPase subunit KdpA [Candidatus Cybelea sp.]
MPWLNAAVFLAILLLAAAPLARYMQAVFEGRLHWKGESAIYRFCGIDPEYEMGWAEYAVAAIVFSLVTTLAAYAIMRTQQWHGHFFNPQGFPNVDPWIAWNTAVSFVTTTDWQFYSGESTMSYLSQMAALAWLNFVAGAIGLAAGVAVIRGFARKSSATLGNFWVDCMRSLFYVLLPLCALFGLLYASQGIPQNFSRYLSVTNAQGFSQSITGGPIASQEAPKLLGGNGGGFVGANSASPNENPNGITNLFELLAIWLIPAALPLLFGRMIGNRGAGATLLIAMLVLGVGSFVGAQFAEQAGNPIVHALGIHGGNMEGKEARFGVANAGLSLAVATDSGTGSSNFAYDSLTPLGGFFALLNLELAEIIFGGVGSGLYGMLVFAIVTVFLAGLMVGRTPEYLGKKIERREVQFAMLAVLIFPCMILFATAVAVVIPAGIATLGNKGPHGFTEILYAFSSSAANNGSAFAGLGPNVFYDVAIGLIMLGGRFLVMIPSLALAGCLAARPTNELAHAGTFRTDSTLFIALLIGVILLVGAITFLPGDLLGPIVEHFELAHLVTY